MGYLSGRGNGFSPGGRHYERVESLTRRSIDDWLGKEMRIGLPANLTRLDEAYT